MFANTGCQILNNRHDGATRMEQTGNELIDLPYREIFMRAPVGMCVSQRRIIHVANTALETMFGFNEGGLANASFELLYPTPREFHSTGERLSHGLWTGKHYSDERIMRRKGGELFWCHVVGQALRPVPGDPVIWTFEDISDKRPMTIKMSGRDREIAVLIADGLTSKEIARRLALSHRTIETYRASLMKKFGATTSSGLIHKLMSAADI